MNLLPVVIVDDDLRYLRAQTDLLRDVYPSRDVLAFTNLLDAGELVTFPGPFLLILDHDFPPSSSTERDFGYFLAQKIRSGHPYGLTIPICYLSGKVNDREFRTISRQTGQLGPTFWSRKGDDSIDSVVDSMDRAFAEVRNLWLNQAERLLIDIAAFDAYDEISLPE